MYTYMYIHIWCCGAWLCVCMYLLSTPKKELERKKKKERRHNYINTQAPQHHSTIHIYMYYVYQRFRKCTCMYIRQAPYAGGVRPHPPHQPKRS